jgi:lysophospholipase L1-like esterase
VKSATNFTVQLYATKDEGGTVLFVRYKLNNIFNPWKNLTSGSNEYSEEMGYFVSTCINKAAITGIDSSTHILAFGDSIVSGVGVTNSWLDNVKNATGCTVINKGVGGALFGESVKSSAYWISTQISSVTSVQWENSNLIIIGAGTNDAGSDTPLDELKTKVLSAITSIRENSNAPIMFITPIRRGSSNTDSDLLKLPMISGIICNAAVANYCSVLNGFDIPIPTYTIGQISDLTQDHLHPNETGAKVYAQAVLNAIN